MFKKVLDFTMTPAGIDTAKLYPLLMSSGLPREALGQIWASANRTTPGMLTKEELYTVLALIGVAQVRRSRQMIHFKDFEQSSCSSREHRTSPLPYRELYENLEVWKHNMF